MKSDNMNMSVNNDLSDTDSSPKLRMKPAVSRIFCCSVTAASGFIAAYALVAYAIALIYEIVWVVESQSGLPIPSVMLMICYCIIIAATVVLVHGLISLHLVILSLFWVANTCRMIFLFVCHTAVLIITKCRNKNNSYLLAWLISVILVLIPECALVFYMSISHWGLQGVYGGAELACYVARLPAIVCGVVLVQSAYALREARKGEYVNGVPVSGSEFDASHFVPDTQTAFTNDGFLSDNGKSGSMPDLRRHLASRQSINMGYPVILQPPPYWQHLERQYPASLRGYPKPPQNFGTWAHRTGPENPYKRRHSVVGAFNYEDYKNFDDRMDCKSEMAYPYRPYIYDPRMFPPDYDPRFFQDYKRDEYMRQDFYNAPDRVYYGMRNSHNSVGNESDDLTKYKDVAL